MSESSYAIVTNDSPSVVYTALRPLMDANDQVYIITLCGPFMGFGPEKVNQWLSDNLAGKFVHQN
ncbi:MAG: hypothetical protein IT318_22935 [Anaerolineales bacterium]|nr:hypothetical protein [Anaerolineales bacterium]